MPAMVGYLNHWATAAPIGMMEAGWSARQVARQLGHSECVISHREDCHIVRNARVLPTASSAASQVPVAPSLRAPVSS
ncbi:hypothetical protein TNCV_4088711 [Trichonephila clavipes]|nr:hypothetical protein TNCV_4088711 [Trichonephila clavipes]